MTGQKGTYSGANNRCKLYTLTRTLSTIHCGGRFFAGLKNSWPVQRSSRLTACLNCPCMVSIVLRCFPTNKSSGALCSPFIQMTAHPLNSGDSNSSLLHKSVPLNCNAYVLTAHSPRKLQIATMLIIALPPKQSTDQTYAVLADLADGMLVIGVLDPFLGYMCHC